MKVFPAFVLQGRYVRFAGGVIVEAIRCVTDVRGIFPNKLIEEDQMKRSYSVLLLICMALALLATTCGSGGSSTSNQHETVTIWHGWAVTFLRRSRPFSTLT